MGRLMSEMRVSSNTLGANFTVHYQTLVTLTGGCPLELLEAGGYRQTTSRAVTPSSADEECAHGRLPGDVCPSPLATKLQTNGKALPQNWPYLTPCACWEGK